MKQYYLVENEQQTGPFSIEQLRSKNIQKDAMVWSEGLTEWVRADSQTDLQNVFSTLPPPLGLPKMQVLPKIQIPHTPTIQTSVPPIGQVNSSYFGYERAGRLGRFLAVLIDAIILYPITMLFSADIMISTIGGIVLSSLAGLLFYPIFSGHLGHKILGYKVISAKDGSDYNGGMQGFVREFLKNIMAFLIIPIIWLLFDERCRNLYDVVLDTYVVKGQAKPKS